MSYEKVLALHTMVLAKISNDLSFQIVYLIKTNFHLIN